MKKLIFMLLAVTALVGCGNKSEVTNKKYDASLESVQQIEKNVSNNSTVTEAPAYTKSMEETTTAEYIETSTETYDEEVIATVATVPETTSAPTEPVTTEATTVAEVKSTLDSFPFGTIIIGKDVTRGYMDRAINQIVAQYSAEYTKHYVYYVDYAKALDDTNLYVCGYRYSEDGEISCFTVSGSGTYSIDIENHIVYESNDSLVNLDNVDEDLKAQLKDMKG